MSEKSNLLLSAVQESHCGCAVALLLQPLVGVFLRAFLSVFVVSVDSSDFPRRNVKQMTFYIHWFYGRVVLSAASKEIWLVSRE